MVNTKHPIIIGYTHKLVADGLESMIDRSDDFTVRESIAIGKMTEFLDSKNAFEIIIVELNYPNQGNLSFLAKIKAEHPTIRIMLLSRLPSVDLSCNLINSGIDAFLLKTSSKYDLFAALHKIVNGKNYFCSEIIKTVLSKNDNPKPSPEIILSPREAEILAMLVNSKTNIYIANELGLSENTVKTHRRNIFTKFGANNIFGMIRYACRARLLDYGPDGFCSGCPNYS